MPTSSSLVRPLVAVALCAAVLAGCGSSSSSSNGLESKSPEQILAAAKSAAKGASTVHMSGSIVSEGKPISLNMELVAGKGAQGHITLEGNGIDIVQVENAFYINGSAAFYKKLAGPAAAALASFAELTNLEKLIDTTLTSHGTLKNSGTKTIAGKKAVGVTDTTNGGTLYVAATGAAFPLEISKPGAGGGQILFDRWNQPVTLTPPANAININQLQSGH
jgi:hypothetical protein